MFLGSSIMRCLIAEETCNKKTRNPKLILEALLPTNKTCVRKSLNNALACRLVNIHRKEGDRPRRNVAGQEVGNMTATEWEDQGEE